jgi:hypothetical protein
MKSVLQVFWEKVVGGFFYSRSEAVTTAVEKNPGKDPPAIVFFCSVSTLIQSGSILSCLTAEKRFLLFKGPGSFKKKEKICGNVEEIKAYRMLPLTPV